MSNRLLRLLRSFRPRRRRSCRSERTRWRRCARRASRRISIPARRVCSVCKAMARSPGTTPPNPPWDRFVDELLINPGWMPVDAVVVDGRPGLTWMNLSDVELKEPFFQQTIDRVREQEPWRGDLFTEFDALLQLDQNLPRVQPSGFIFH